MLDYPILGQTKVEKFNGYKISRCIYHIGDSLNILSELIRIFEFPTKTVVIASKLSYPLLWNESLIKKTIQDFSLDPKKLHWINHRGLFSSIDYQEEQFLYTFFSYNKESIFSNPEINIIKDKMVSLQSVERFIECSLEPVEYWLGLDPLLREKVVAKREKKITELTYIYLQSQIEYLSKCKEVIDILATAREGTILFYPNRDLKVEFQEYFEIDNSNNSMTKKILPYIREASVENEIVVSIFIGDFRPYCIIIPKEAFMSSNFQMDNSFIERSAKCLLNSFTKAEMDLFEYRQNQQQEEERKKYLLNQLVFPKLNHIISEFQESEFIYKSEFGDVRGAFVYYPEIDCSDFIHQSKIHRYCDAREVSYLDEYDVENEIVVCVQPKSQPCACNIFSKKSILE